jgi:integrase
MANRRANGESSIYKATDGRWHGWVSVGLRPDGKRDRRHVTGKNRPVVVEKVRSLERARDAGTIAAARIPTVAEWFDHWLTNIAPRRVRARTLESYEATVRLHITPTLGAYRLDRLQPEHLEQLYTNMDSRGLSSATALRAHRIVARALKVAHQRGRVNRNVALLVDAPSIKRSQIAQALTLEEAQAVLRAAAKGRNAARWSVALALGLRQSEALGLQWCDIDLLKNTLTVRRTQHRVKGVGIVYEDPKTERSRRTLALPGILIGQLHQHKAIQNGERMLAGSEWRDDDLVFAREDGKPIDKKRDYDDWCELLERAGVRHVRLHDGRHTAATLLLSEGVHPRVVMELLGHSQMRTTTDIYSHVMPALAQEAADRMSALLSAEPPAPSGPRIIEIGSRATTAFEDEDARLT